MPVKNGNGCDVCFMFPVVFPTEKQFQVEIRIKIFIRMSTLSTIIIIYLMNLEIDFRDMQKVKIFLINLKQ